MKDLEEILQYRKPAPKKYNKELAEKIEGVYFLFLNNELVYIGKSINIYARLNSHKIARTEFDSFCYLEVEYEKLLEVEKKYIKKFKPKHNHAHNPDKKKEKSDMRVVTVQLDEEDYKYLKEYSKRISGKANISLGVRMLIIEKRKEESLLNANVVEHEVITDKTVK